MSHVDQGWLDRLDAATDYHTLFVSEFGPPHHISGEELWAKCPLHPGCDDPGKWSMNVKRGQWRCYKTDTKGSMISLLREIRPKSWREAWINACPNTKDVFGIEQRDRSTPERDSTRGPVDHASLARDAAGATKDDDLKPLAEKWGLTVDVLRRQGWFVMPGGRDGKDHPKFCVVVQSPSGGKIVGIKIRYLPPYPTKKDKEGKEHPTKSRLMSDSKPGLLGLERLLVKGTDGVPLPVLIVEGEKDWSVATAHLPGMAVLSPSHGSSTSFVNFTQVFTDRDVTVLYDEDDPGNKGARGVLSTLLGVARSVRWAHIGQPGKDLFNVVVDDGGGLPALVALIDKAERFTIEAALQDVASVIRSAIDPEEAPKVVDLADHIFKTLTAAGALWLKTRNNDGYCVYAGRVYETGGGDPGLALRLGEWTGIDAFSGIGIRLGRQLHALTIERGVACDTNAWYARKGDGLYLPLCDEKQQVVELLPSGISIQPNGRNGVVVLPSKNIMPIKWMEDFDEKQANIEWAKFFNLFTCSNEDRRLLEAIVLMTPLYDWIDTHPIMRFRGAPGSGKSTAAKLITLMLYGEERLFTATNAAMYRMGTNLPLIVLDNIEADGVDDNMQLFFLLAATGVEKVKSAMDSASRVIVERVRSWVLTTGVDPISFGKRELAERALLIPFGSQNTEGFMPKAVSEWIKSVRDLLWNLILRKTCRSISALKGGALDRVSLGIPKLDRPRLKEFYAMASIVLGGTDTPHPDIMFLLDEHTQEESDASVEDNPLVDLLCFLPAYCKTMQGDGMGIRINEIGTGFQTDWIQTQRLSVALSSIARTVGRQYPFRSTAHMSTRIGLVQKQLTAIGFKIERSENAVFEGKRMRAWRFFIPKSMGRTEGLFSEVP